MASGAILRKGKWNKQFGTEGRGYAAAGVDIKTSFFTGVGTSSRSLREDIKSTSTFKQQLESRRIQFDLSEQRLNDSKVRVRTVLSESESRAPPSGPGYLNQGAKNRFIDEARKKALNGLLKEVIKQLRNRLDL